MVMGTIITILMIIRKIKSKYIKHEENISSVIHYYLIDGGLLFLNDFGEP
ncbi:hypothetical protein PEC106664_32800 [Pectobacterium carotovorum subsp. carotovorum]|nr:hypothetical protein PEC106664_32800 [Pectobacterium carotovorum subsp. carotovorum]